MFRVWDRRYRSLLPVQPPACRIRLERFEGRGSCLLQRLVKPLHGPQGLADFDSQTGGGTTERTQDVLLTVGPRLLCWPANRHSDNSRRAEGTSVQFFMVWMVSRPSKRSSLVTSVRSMACAVAARNRSAGSRCGSGNCCAASTMSWVKGASRRGAMACASPSARLAGKARCECREEVSLAHRLDVCFVDHRSHYVAQDLHAVLHGADPVVRFGIGRRRHNLGDGLTETRDPNGLLGLPYTFQ